MILYNHKQKKNVPWIIMIILAFIIVGWGGSVFALAKKDLRRISDEGPVEITLVYLNPLQQKAAKEFSFDVVMETHSVDLDAYKMETVSFLRIDGKQEQKALGWFNPGGGGHHISGVLKFAGPIASEAKSIQVIIRGVGDVKERIFEWKLPLK